MFLNKARQLHAIFQKQTLLIIILAFGAVLRIAGIGWGLPYLLHPDEWQMVRVYLTMVKTHSLHPHYFTYPALLFYVNGFFYSIYYGLLRLTGFFHSSRDIAFPKIIAMGTGVIADPNVYLIARSISVLFGLGTIYLGYRCAKAISKNNSIGLLAAAMIAVSNEAIVQSRLILPNIYVAFFALLTLWFSLKLYETGQTRPYLFAGIAIGLTIASKYNGGVIAITLITAHFLRTGKKGWKDPRIYLAFLLAGASFLMTNIYAVLDFKKFIADFLGTRDAYVGGAAWMDDITALWYSSYLMRFETIATLAALGGLVYGAAKRQPYYLIAGSFPLVYFIALSMMKYYNEHTLLHLMPFIHVIGACFIGLVIEKGLARYGNRNPWARALSTLLVVTAVALPLWISLTNQVKIFEVNSQTTARIWIEQNITPGSRIALEPYSPYIDPKKYQVIGVPQPYPQTLSWYQESHAEYLVFSEGMFGRYYLHPEKNQAQVDQYELLFKSLLPVKIFNDGNYEIRIYRMNRQ